MIDEDIMVLYRLVLTSKQKIECGNWKSGNDGNIKLSEDLYVWWKWSWKR